MKNFFSFLVLIILGILAYNHFTATVSEDEQYLIDMKTDFKNAVKRTIQSERAAAAAGVDTTGSFETGIETAKEIREDLIEFIDELDDEKIIDKATNLKKKVDAFLTENGVVL